MSGQDTINQLDQIVATTNELFLSEEAKMVALPGGGSRPTNAKVIADLAVQMAGAQIYTTAALGLQATPSGAYFSVLASSSDAYVTLYRNDSGAATPIDTYPNAQAIRDSNTVAMGTRTELGKLVRPADAPAQDQQIYVITNAEGEAVVEQSGRAYRSPNLYITAKSGVTTIGDEEGNVLVHADKDGMIMGMMVQLPCDTPGWFIANAEGEVIIDLSSPGAETITDDPLASGLLFAPLIVTGQGFDQTIYTQGLVTRRQLAPKVVASLASTSTSKSETSAAIRVSAGAYGQGTVLNVRSVDAPSARRFMSVAVRNVPVQNPAVPVKILLLGDSILNRQGGLFLKQALVALGFAPTFIGTLNTSNSATSAGDTSGELGEAREGWETGDYTNAITDRSIILPPGEESSYLAMSKLDKRDRNVFARAATGSDPASVVRNGYVFDPAFYQSRFGLATPDIVINDLGTNDVRDRSAAEIYDAVLSNDTIIQSQIRKAWPDAKVVRFVPGTSIANDRNAVWTSHYLPLIRAIQQSLANRADSKVILAPLWALTNPEVGYEYTSGTPGADGFVSTGWFDPVHPIQASRLALFEALAPYVGAAAAGII